jgi:hypothetical protein
MEADDRILRPLGGGFLGRPGVRGVRRRNRPKRKINPTVVKGERKR